MTERRMERLSVERLREMVGEERERVVAERESNIRTSQGSHPLSHIIILPLYEMLRNSPVWHELATTTWAAAEWLEQILTGTSRNHRVDVILGKREKDPQEILERISRSHNRSFSFVLVRFSQAGKAICHVYKTKSAESAGWLTKELYRETRARAMEAKIELIPGTKE